MANKKKYKFISAEEQVARKAKFDGRTFYLYRHLRKDNGQPFYVGQAAKREKIQYPSEEYKRANQRQGHNTDWEQIVKEAGGYIVEIILDNLTNDNIDDKEIEFIALYGRTVNGGILCNQTDGGRWGFAATLSKETRARIAEGQIMTIQDSIDKYVYPEPNTGCFIWTGCFDYTNNNMKISYEKKDGSARKVIYEYLNGVTINKGEYVVNTCGCVHCVNPQHTKLIKTPPTDKRDSRKGEAFWKTILTEEQVLQIKKEIITEPSNSKIAKCYNVDRTTIYRIRTGENWGWLNG